MNKKITDKISGRMRNVLKVSTGTLAGQIIMFVSVPLLTRMYGIEIVGVATLIASFAAIVNAISDLGITNSLMLEDDEEKAIQIYEVISSLSFVISFILAAGIVVYNHFLSLDLGVHWLFALFYIFLTFFLSKQGQICYTWLNKKQKYSLLMKNPIINSSVYLGVAYGLGALGYLKYGYFIGYIVGVAFSVIRMKYHLPKKMLTRKFEKYKVVIKGHMNFIRYEMPNNILAQVKTQLPVLLIKIFFNNQILGYYAITVKILNIPINLLANALGRVFFQVASEYKNDLKKVGEFTYRNMSKAMKLVILPMAFLIGFGDVVVLLIFGRGFERVGVMLQIVALQTAITFISLTVQGISTITRKQKWSMISLISQIVFIFIFFSIGVVVFDSIYVALGIMSVIVIVVDVVYYCVLFNFMKISWFKYVVGVLTSMVLMFALAICMRILADKIGLVALMEGIIR